MISLQYASLAHFHVSFIIINLYIICVFIWQNSLTNPGNIYKFQISLRAIYFNVMALPKDYNQYF